MWKIHQILEADYGCEERLPGQPLMALVYLVDEYGQTCQFEVEDQWLIENNLDEGDEWTYPIEIAVDNSLENTADHLIDNQADNNAGSAQKQMEWMDNYLDALDELEDSEE